MRDDEPRAVTTICHALQEQIQRGLLPPGEKLPAERQLSELFGTTRITLREALVQLEAQGLIYREERRGWFVSPPRLAYDLNSRSHFHAMVAAQGREPQTQMLSARLQPASASICQRLQLPALSSVIQICRARRIDRRPVLYVEHYLKPEYFPGILDCDLDQSLTELYAERYGVHYGQVTFDLLPTALHAEAAAALKVSLGTPGLCIARVNHDREGRLIDCDLEYWRHDAIHVSAVMRDR
ncbi:UTRA domain-containing protein [Pseudomonas sp. DTU_2021_1001937_2_SI_NGA_ILE_001]|uniref:UTRA domain-containing protein n=1 Tax=Pseudomonas sp. DTU_2021_1001937_2_SI_NGA_ILE_001 TaxID=3077589 RepID=UPI0028FC23C9|nr:UTRA domain-containing protein [Pseudomonas sp. DTU_2021_1001937_2_SI_NGA_ILE_001]WNW14043.1 UTRA domain-containing protein [Pseudomonas sp. DTU_2021_1001937_2_SI_NGA_ILE_001]